MTHKQAKPDAAKPDYKPTPEECAVVKKVFSKTFGQVPRVKVDKNEISLAHRCKLVGQALLQDALGALDPDFFAGLLEQLANVTSDGSGAHEGHLNFLVSAVKGIAPRDPIEAMLAGQMAVVHVATMTLARRLAKAETILQQDSAERGLNKLARTFATQIEALNRHRAAGEQKAADPQESASESTESVADNQLLGKGKPDEAATSTTLRADQPTTTGVTERSATVVPMKRRSGG